MTMLTYTDETPMPFSQYRGMRMADVPTSFLLELLERDNAPEPMRNYIIQKYKDRLCAGCGMPTTLGYCNYGCDDF